MDACLAKLSVVAKAAWRHNCQFQKLLAAMTVPRWRQGSNSIWRIMTDPGWLHQNGFVLTGLAWSRCAICLVRSHLDFMHFPCAAEPGILPFRISALIRKATPQPSSAPDESVYRMAGNIRKVRHVARSPCMCQTTSLNHRFSGLAHGYAIHKLPSHLNNALKYALLVGCPPSLVLKGRNPYVSAQVNALWWSQAVSSVSRTVDCRFRENRSWLTLWACMRLRCLHQYTTALEVVPGGLFDCCRPASVLVDSSRGYSASACWIRAHLARVAAGNEK